MKAVGVFCGSASAVHERHREAARELGREIARRGLRLVYGGGRVGLMGDLSDAALGEGGEVVGVIPEFLFRMEVGHTGVTELHRVGSMHERKALMADLSDGFVALGGGLGTLDETIEIITWKQLGLHRKPVVLLSLDGFWGPLVAQTERFAAEGFTHPEHRGLWSVVERLEDVFDALETSPLPSVGADAKWTGGT